MSIERTYTVNGMTCEAVAVDLDSGRVTVTGDADEAAVRAAVDDAGYQVVG